MKAFGAKKLKKRDLVKSILAAFTRLKAHVHTVYYTIHYYTVLNYTTCILYSAPDPGARYRKVSFRLWSVVLSQQSHIS